MPVELPDDPRVRDLVVRAHSLESYDALTEDITNQREHDDDEHIPTP